MSMERSGAGSAAEAVPGVRAHAPAADGAGSAAGIPPGLLLQILSTEHWSLLATRSLVWNEVFARAGMFLASLSGAIVALALVGQGSGFGDSFVLFAEAILPVVLFVGVTSFLRLGAANWHDAQCIIGMNRIRAAYLELAPDIERYFVMGHHDDMRGIGQTMGVRPDASQAVHLLAATPTLVSVINAVISGALAGLVAHQAGAATTGVLVASIVAFALVFGAHLWYGRTSVRAGQASLRQLFPSPDGERPADP